MPFDFELFYKVVPRSFKDKPVRYIKLGKQEKAPLEKEWQKVNNYSIEEIVEWIIDDNNYGIMSTDGTIVFIDADTKEIQNDLDKLPPTLHYTTGKPEHMHYIYSVDTPFKNIPLQDGAYVKGKNGYIVGVGSVHPNGSIYGKIEMYANPIANISTNDLMAVLEPYLMKKTDKMNTTPEEQQSDPISEADTITPPQSDIDSVVSDMLPLWENADSHRHDLALSIIGWLKRKKWNKQTIYLVISTLIKMTNKGYEHLAQVNYCYNDTRSGWGYPKILEIKDSVFK